jgi:hypothetical protein
MPWFLATIVILIPLSRSQIASNNRIGDTVECLMIISYLDDCLLDVSKGGLRLRPATALRHQIPRNLTNFGTDVIIIEFDDSAMRCGYNVLPRRLCNLHSLVSKTGAILVDTGDEHLDLGNFARDTHSKTPLNRMIN